MTELPKQYEHKDAQQRWAKFWDEKGYFQSDPQRGKIAGKKPFTIVIPPPNVTGALHLGHALNNTLQDIMIRYHRMRGFETLWVPGVDHAGIATQAVVERRMFEEEGKTRHDVGRENLVARIWAWKEQYQTRIINQLKEMGCSCDWRRTRFTFDATCAKAVRHFFFGLFRDTLIYRGKRLVNWDVHLQTAVSDDEVYHEEVAGSFWYINYPVIDPKPNEPAFVTVATTRPETMLGDTAVAIHPSPKAAMESLEKELNAEISTASEKEKTELTARREALQKRREETLDSLETLAAMARDGRMVMLPLMNRPIPLICDVWAKPELGTGCVKITPAHDPNDYEVGKRQNLLMINLLNRDGTLNENAGVYAGQKNINARAMIVADLEKAGLLVKTEDRLIDLAHSERSKTPIEPFLNDQWFVKMDKLAQSAMDAVAQEQVKITPPRYAKSYLDWLGEKRDWPIGRQLWWGHQIPIWYFLPDATSANQDVKTTSETELQKAFAGRNDVLWQWDEEHSQWWICSQMEDLAEDAIPGRKLVREEDVLDTWFSSALWPHSTLGWPDQTEELAYYYPTNVLITSRDIITLWVARMVLAGLFNCGKVPFPNVYIHPKILDKYGEGMSKSKGNGVDPVKVIEKFGADALRFALTHLTTENQDVRLALDFECPYCQAIVEQTKKNRTQPRVQCPKCKKEFATQWAEKEEDKALQSAPVIGERFEVARNFCNKFWNAARFVMMNLSESAERETHSENFFQSQQEKDLTKDNSQIRSENTLQIPLLLLEDKWILSRLATVTQQVTAEIEAYRFSEVARTLYDFAWDEFCSFYVEMVKYRLSDPALRPAAERILAYVLDTLTRLLHPIVPFVTEEIWQRLNEIVPKRGLTAWTDAAESITIAAWAEADTAAIDSDVENQFGRFQEVLRAVREVRSRQNVPPKTEMRFVVKCDARLAEILKPMTPYFESMAGAIADDWGENVKLPALSSNVAITGVEIFVDLAGLIDITAELAKKSKDIQKLEGFIKAKESKLSNEAFVNKAPKEVLDKERDSLADLQKQLSAAKEAVKVLEESQK
ncbi:MAG: class I tRNA ligase family protein [Planctomycetaceae bacterium]|jgi:valyl-tRNA synthetase|nr:class I tRNA ligase family protein [Planctomycetaceae bacterium]